MAVVRINKTSDYTIMSNAHFKEKEMTLKAKGLLSLMLSLPDNWDYSIAGLATLSKDGKDSIMNALQELEAFHYLVRTRKVDQQGKFAGYDYDIYELPQSEKPYSENPYTEKPYSENPPQLNTNIPITKEVSTKEIYNGEFAELWKLYPNKQGKENALKAYIKARKAGTTFEQVKQGLLNYAQYCKLNKTDKQYIKHGSTWFNGREWESEYDLSAPKRKPSYNAVSYETINGTEYEVKNGQYYIKGGCGVAVNPFAADDLPY